MKTIMSTLLFVCLGLMTSCASRVTEEHRSSRSALETPPKEPLLKVNYIDQNGLSETVVLPDRVKQFASIPLCAPQSYKKLLRIYKKDIHGNAKSIVTSYYDNGQIHQFLSCVNSRANGIYCEWHENGQKKLESYVQAGIADLNDAASKTWAFHGIASAWDENGHLIASCQYDQGKLTGEYSTYYANGSLASKSSWKEGLQYGHAYTYDHTGALQEEISFEKGQREGPSRTFYKSHCVGEELYEKDLLIVGTYQLPNGKLLSTVQKGWGTRSLLEDGSLTLQHEVHNGRPEGLFTHFDEHGRIERTYTLVEGKKHGIETFFYTSSGQKKMTLQWVDGEINGFVQTWYSTGVMESSKEMCHNQKHGMTTCWYLDGSIMLVEEYQTDKLIRGKYHRKGSTAPVSIVEQGTGIATLFDGAGNLVETIPYRDSLPEIKG